MAKILEMRRVFETVKQMIWDYEWVKNPHYDANQALEYERQGVYYPEEEFIEKESAQAEKAKTFPY